MSEKNPLVSILIPTYNQPEYFRQALKSALDQDYPNIEIIVSDDSTNSDVKNICDEFENVRYIYHGGNYTNETNFERTILNIENLLEHASGEYVNILFHDDLIYPRKISTMMQYFTGEYGDQIALVTSARDVIDEHGIFQRHVDELDNINLYANAEQDHIVISGETAGRLIFLMIGNFIGELSTVLIRKKDFFNLELNKYLPYFLGVKDRSMYDVSTYLTACKDGRYVIFIREPLSAFRLVGGNQNTFNPKIRLNIIEDWLSFITAAYLKNVYIHGWNEFCAACKYWLFIANGQILTLEDVPESIKKAIQAGKNKNYEKLFKIGKTWIKKYSSKTFDFGGSL